MNPVRSDGPGLAGLSCAVDLARLGIEININRAIGKVLSLKELIAEDYEAIFVGSGKKQQWPFINM